VNSAFGIAIVVLVVVWGVSLALYLVVFGPRRRERVLRECAETAARALGLQVVEPGRAAGRFDGATVEVSYAMARPLRTTGHAYVTSVRTWLEPPFAVPFVVAAPPVLAGGVTKRWANDVAIGGLDAEALALAERLAPHAQQAARAHHGEVMSIQIDRATIEVVLRDHVIEQARLARALALAIELAHRVREPG
jgi:hypothetical protein